MKFFDDDKFLCKGLALVIIIGIVIRIVLGYCLEYNNDITAMMFTITNIDGGNGLYGIAGYYYPPVWGYMLAVFAEVIEHLGIDSLGDFFTEILFMEEIEEEASVTTPEFNLAYSMYVMISDLLVSVMVYLIIEHFTEDRVKAKVGFTLFFLGINVIIISAVGGMFDSFSALMTLLCFYLLIKRYDFLAGVMFAMAVLLKLFPVFLIFLLVCYVLEDKENWKSRLTKAVLGAGIFSVIIMLPQLIDGTLLESISFMTDRADSSEEYSFFLLKYRNVITYAIIFILSLGAAILFRRQKKEDVDRVFLWYMIIVEIITFLSTGAPQYLILLTPFLIIAAIMFDKRMYLPLAILMVGSTIAQTAHISSEFVSITLYNHLLSFDSWVAFYDFFTNDNEHIYNIWEDIGYLLEEASVLIAGLFILDHFGINYRYLKGKWSKFSSKGVSEESNKND